MIDPYATLGISSQADESEIRRSYLQLVREFPPEKSPEKFSEIRAAYEQLRDPAQRLIRIIFEFGSEHSLPDIIANVRKRMCAARIPTDLLLSLAED